MNLIDVLIISLVVLALLHGWWRGFTLSVSMYLGSLAGLLFGALYSPRIADALGIDDPAQRQFAGFFGVFLGLALGGVLGELAGAPFHRVIMATPALRVLNSTLGAGLSALVMLAMAWLLGLGLARGPNPELSRMIQSSTILHEVAAVAPRPPSFVARLEALLSARLDPQVFAGLEPLLPKAIPPAPDNVDTPGVATAAAATVRIAGVGCGGRVLGSGFPIAANLVMTNAHVVAGTRNLQVETADGKRRLNATLVSFDPDRDIAVLRVPNLNLAVLPRAAAERGTQGVIIGYPGGGPEKISPTVVTGVRTAKGRDIYDEDLVERHILTLVGEVRPGNSGGPVVDTEGRLVGMVFATSTRDPEQAYALALVEITPAIQAAVAGGGEIDERAQRCA